MKRPAGAGVGGVVLHGGSFPGWGVRRRRWPGLRWWQGLGAAGPGGVVGQGDDVGVGQVGGLDPLGGAAFGDQEGFAGVEGADVGGGESGGGPAVAEDDVGAAGGGAAERGAVAEQVAQALGDDVHARAAGWRR